MAGGRFELAREPTAIVFLFVNSFFKFFLSNSETHMNAIYDARLIYRRGGFHGY